MQMQYVRREIRQLTEKDREAFFDAMEALYRLPSAEGQHLYGDEYQVWCPNKLMLISKMPINIYIHSPPNIRTEILHI